MNRRDFIGAAASMAVAPTLAKIPGAGTDPAALVDLASGPDATVIGTWRCAPNAAVAVRAYLVDVMRVDPEAIDNDSFRRAAIACDAPVTADTQAAVDRAESSIDEIETLLAPTPFTLLYTGGKMKLVDLGDPGAPW